MTTWQLYLITRLDSLNTFFDAIIGICICLMFILFMHSGMFDNKEEEKEFFQIYAAKWATNSEEMKQLPDNTVKAINKLLEDYIKDDKK